MDMSGNDWHHCHHCAYSLYNDIGLRDAYVLTTSVFMKTLLDGSELSAMSGFYVLDLHAPGAI